MVFLLNSVAAKKGWIRNPLDACDCLAQTLVENESEQTIRKLKDNFDYFGKLSEIESTKYMRMCVPA